MNYTQLNDRDLDRFITRLENECTSDGYEPEELAGALEERQIRAECASDLRVAQALGRS